MINSSHKAAQGQSMAIGTLQAVGTLQKSDCLQREYRRGRGGVKVRAGDRYYTP